MTKQHLISGRSSDEPWLSTYVLFYHTSSAVSRASITSRAVAFGRTLGFDEKPCKIITLPHHHTRMCRYQANFCPQRTSDLLQAAFRDFWDATTELVANLDRGALADRGSREVCYLLPLSRMEKEDEREGAHVSAVPKAEAQQLGFGLISFLKSPSAVPVLSRILSTHLRILKDCVTDNMIAVPGTQVSEWASCQGAQRLLEAGSVRQTNARHDVLDTDPTRAISVDAQVMTVKYS